MIRYLEIFIPTLFTMLMAWWIMKKVDQFLVYWYCERPTHQREKLIQ